MDLYGLICLVGALAFVVVVLAAWLRGLLADPCEKQPKWTEDWHPMLVFHGNLHESEDRL